MQLALRSDEPRGAGLWQSFACWLIRARLVSRYSHGGVVIDGHLYHATTAGGLHMLKPGEWSPELWDLFDTEADSATALQLYAQHAGAGYDWFSLLAFVGVRARDARRFYCYEWCWMALTGEGPKARVTPEVLLRFALKAHP